MAVLVVDASVAVAACHTPVGFASFHGHELVAPQLMFIRGVARLDIAVRLREL
jgi:hypothetical protein